jgi:N-acetylmuramidase
MGPPESDFRRVSFQIVGTYWNQTGAADVATFVSEEFASEANQLRHFANLVQSRGLVAAINAHDWANFALHYNGAGYARNRYDTQLVTAYARRTATH